MTSKSMDKNINTTYVFTHTTFLDALSEWEKAQIESYPDQAERIQITSLAMQDFMQSPQVKGHKMILSTSQPENI